MIKQKPQTNGIEIDLTGPQGNAYFLMGMVRKSYPINLIWMVTKYLKEMMSGDYENLVKVFDNNFGSVVTLYR